jgi:glucokinase
MLRSFLIFMGLFSWSCNAMHWCTLQQYEQPSKNSTPLFVCIISKTDTTIGLFTENIQKPQFMVKLTRKTTEITNFTDFISAVLQDLEKNYYITITKACFCVPGNPSEHKNFIQPFNISFAVDAQSIRAASNLKNIFVVNDFEVVGYGIDIIDPKNIIQINAGKYRPQWPKTIVGAGAGLGSCLMIWDPSLEHYKPSPLGFCYSDFAPHTSADINLVDFIQRTSDMKNVSWGYLLGLKGGIEKIYEFLNSTTIYEEPFISYQTPQDIFNTRTASQRCADAVDLYIKLYTRLLRNVAYITLPYAGLYITNSVVENNRELFESSSFFSEMLHCNNDLLAAIIADIPVYCVIDPHVKLYGATHYCMIHLSAR